MVSWVLSGLLRVYLWEGRSSPLRSILAGSRSLFLHLQTRLRRGGQTVPSHVSVALTARAPSGGQGVRPLGLQFGVALPGPPKAILC